MTSWHIIRCERHHDAKVAGVIRAAGWDVWMPQQLVITRHPAARRQTQPADKAFKEKWFPLLPGYLFSAIRTLPDALEDGARYPCSLVMAAPYVPALVAFEALSGFMAKVDAANEETRRRNTPRRPAVRAKEVYRDLKSAGEALIARAAGVKLEDAA